MTQVDLPTADKVWLVLGFLEGCAVGLRHSPDEHQQRLGHALSTEAFKLRRSIEGRPLR